MKKIVLILFSICLSFRLAAQQSKGEKPDYKKIKSETTHKSSKFYYLKLLEKYNKQDTTLTKEEFQLLYYGSFFQDSYSAYGHSSYSDSLTKILSKDSLLIPDYNTIIKYENLVLNQFPFNMRDLNILAYSYEQKGLMDSSKFADYKLTNIITTILNTGDGETEETAWHVISVDDEYDILSVLGFKFGGEQSLTGKGCDYLTLQENQAGIKGFYFDVNKILDAEAKLFKGK